MIHSHAIYAKKIRQNGWSPVDSPWLSHYQCCKQPKVTAGHNGWYVVRLTYSIGLTDTENAFHFIKPKKTAIHPIPCAIWHSSAPCARDNEKWCTQCSHAETWIRFFVWPEWKTTKIKTAAVPKNVPRWTWNWWKHKKGKTKCIAFGWLVGCYAKR